VASLAREIVDKAKKLPDEESLCPAHSDPQRLRQGEVEEMKNFELDQKKYARLLSKTRPHVIRSDEDLEHFTEELLRLDRLENPTPEEQELAALLTALIERYEDEYYPIRRATLVETMRLLLEQRSLRDKDLWPIVGSKSHTSQILSGKREIGKVMASRLAAFFHVDPDLFIQWKRVIGESRITNNSQGVNEDRHEKVAEPARIEGSSVGEWPHSRCLWNRCTLRLRITTPNTARAAISGQSTLIPDPLRKMPRTISMK
jgi:HTH-type transcriptional regulator/antitoxin HigA